MAPFWQKPMDRVFKRNKNQNTQTGKPSTLVVRSSDSTGNTSKPGQVVRFTNADYGAHDKAAPATVHSASSSKQPLTTISPTPTPQATLSAPTVGSPQPSPAGSATCMHSGLRGPLWNQAYDGLKEKEPELVDAYERILSRELSGGEWSSINLESQKNEIEQGSPEKRRSQMMRLIQAGLDRTEKEAEVKQGIEDRMQAVHSVKNMIDKAVKAAPEAALAWVGVCFALEIFANPISEAVSNRSGLAYVVSRMDWYWNLSDLLLDKYSVEKSSAGLRDELEKHVGDLYKKLIAYQMRSVCSYYRNGGMVIFRDMIKLDDWDGQLKSVTDAEETVRMDSDQYNTQQIRSHLYDLVSTTRSEELKLQNIYLALQYQTTQQKEVHEDEEDKKFRKDLFTTDPRDDKDRIEQTKGGLLKDSYRWILENPDFRKWREDPQSRLLWVKGDPGKGKTMLICGIIDEMKKLGAGNSILSFFFCQATDTRINNATAVLRGLVHLLIFQQPSLISHVRKNYDYADKRLFEGPNAYVVLSRILTNILCDPGLRPTYLIIDALDECVLDLQPLLDLIVQELSASARVKWIVSSRNWPVIEGRLQLAGQKVQLSLELNEDSIAAAVEIYIQQKVVALGQLMNYDEKTRSAVQDYLSLNAKGTFLWVALVCENLKKMENISPRKTLKALKAFPPGLDSLYGRMKDQIFEMADVDDINLCQQILAVATTVYQPVTLHELLCFIKFPEHDTSDDVVSLKQVIGLCGSFLTIRDDTIYFVHQSAKDYLTEKASSAIFPCGPEDVHHSIFSRSLQAMSMPETLRRNIYALPWPGFPIANINKPNPDPLAAVRYSCVYWVNHLCDGHTPSSSHRGDLDDGGPVSVFLKKHFLHWLEALSLFRSMSEGIVSIRRLESLFPEQSSEGQLVKFVRDARRFILYNKWAIENAPLQAYTSALIFSPVQSLVRESFKKEAPAWITTKPITERDWSPCLQTLEGHDGGVMSVAFSNDSKLVASGSKDKTIKIWVTATGKEMQTFKGHGGWVTSVVFSNDSKFVISGSIDKTIKIWETVTGKEMQTFEGHRHRVTSVAFSNDSKLVVSGSHDKTIKIWETATGKNIQTFEGHGNSVKSVAFSNDSKFVISGSIDKTIKIWETVTGKEMQTFEGHRHRVTSVAFSNDSKLVVSGSDDKTIKIWETATGKNIQTFEGHNKWVSSVAFSNDSKFVVSGSIDKTIKIWDIATGKEIQTFEGHGGWVNSVAFSNDSKFVVSGSEDKTIKIWDIATGEEIQTFEGHGGWVNSVAFSNDSKLVVSGASDKTIKIWDIATGEEIQTFEGHGGWVTSVAFSNDSKLVASGSNDGTIKIWEVATGKKVSDIEVFYILFRISFDTTCSYLFTDIGAIKISDGMKSYSDVEAGTHVDAQSQELQRQGYGLSTDRAWIMWNEHNVLWLPPDYRPHRMAVSPLMFAIGCHSGRLYTIGFSGPPV